MTPYERDRQSSTIIFSEDCMVYLSRIDLENIQITIGIKDENINTSTQLLEKKLLIKREDLRREIRSLTSWAWDDQSLSAL